MTKEEFIIIGDAYIKSYKRTCAIDDALKEYGVYLECGDDPVIFALEKVIEMSSPMAIECLLDIANEGYTSFCNNGETNEFTNYYTVQQLADYLFPEES